MIKLPIFILSWVLYLVLRTVFILLGLVIVPILSVLDLTKTEVSKVNNRIIYNWKYKLFYIWSNDEDGVIAGEELLGYPRWVRMIYWSAIRNPANNLRFIKGFSCVIEPQNVKFAGTNLKKLNGTKYTIYPFVTVGALKMYDSDEFRFITLTWCGFYSNLRIQFKMNGKIWRAWIGYKIYPHDSFGIPETDYRYHGAGFATQFKRIYPR